MLNVNCLSLPVHLGGLGILSPVKNATHEHTSSMRISAPLALLITQQCMPPTDLLLTTHEIKLQVRSEKRQTLKAAADVLKTRLTPSLQRAMELAQEKGASKWLTVLPLEALGFDLHKTAF